MRHTSTDFSQNDAKMTGYEDCANQRNLTDKGRAEAREIGAHVKRLRIPVGDGLKTLLSTRPAGKTNTVISSHGNPFQAVTGSPYLAEGEMAVVQPRAEAGFTVVSRIRLEDWKSLD